MKYRSTWAGVTLIGAVFLAGASSCETRVEEITLFHTNDLHSSLSASRANAFQLGGIARLSTLLERLRKESPHSLTLDAGDWSEGKWHFSLDMGRNMLKFLELLRYDVTVLGNHDYLAGPDVVADTILSAQVPFPVLAANIDPEDYPNAEKIRKALPATFVTKVGDVKVGVIGLTTNSILFDSFFKPIRIMNPLWTAEKAALKLRPQVDVLILLSHNDFPVNEALAAAIPGLDVVISGHTHKKTPTPKFVSGFGREVPVVEAGKWGEFVGELKLEVSRVSRRTRVKSYRLIPVSPDIPEDPEIAKAITAQDAELGARFGEDIQREVAHSEIALSREERKESTLANLAAKAYRDATGAQVALEESSLVGADLPAGALSLKELHDVAPHVYDRTLGREWTLRIWNAKGKDLNRLYQVFYTVNGFMPLGWTVGWLSAANLEFIWNPTSAVFPAVQFITIGGEPLDREGIYSVAMTEGLATGLRIASEKLKMNLDFSDMRDTGIEGWRAVVSYASRDGRLTRENLRVGRGARTQSSDLAVFDYGIEWDGKVLLVEVENLGLTTSLPGKLKCDVGLRDNPVVYGTSAQEWSEIATMEFPRLRPGGMLRLEVPWLESVLVQGQWPVRCEVQAEGETFLENNAGMTVFPVPGARRI